MFCKTDPVKNLLPKYPRLVIIKAAFNLFKDRKKISTKDLEGMIEEELEKCRSDQIKVSS